MKAKTQMFTHSRLAREFDFVRLHLTNAKSVGVVQLISSLLPEFIKLGLVSDIWLPDSGPSSSWVSPGSGVRLHRYGRILPNAASRFLEVTFLSSQFEGDGPLVVFGDLPLRVSCRQILFFQNALLLSDTGVAKSRSGLLLRVSRLLLRTNLKFIDSVIVQTNVMRNLFLNMFPSYSGDIQVLSQPAPYWLLNRERRCMRHRVVARSDRLRLAYPSAWYPHKNHIVLLGIDEEALYRECEVSISLPIEPKTYNLHRNKAIKLLGFLRPDEMIELYNGVDGLLFLSSIESYGFPLVEAMYLGHPIVCPDEPYARELCGDKAFYFDLNEPESILRAIMKLKSALIAGYRPNWDAELSDLPAKWSDVASTISAIALDERINQIGL